MLSHNNKLASLETRVQLHEMSFVFNTRYYRVFPSSHWARIKWGAFCLEGRSEKRIEKKVLLKKYSTSYHKLCTFVVSFISQILHAVFLRYFHVYFSDSRCACLARMPEGRKGFGGRQYRSRGKHCALQYNAARCGRYEISSIWIFVFFKATFSKLSFHD